MTRYLRRVAYNVCDALAIDVALYRVDKRVVVYSDSHVRTYPRDVPERTIRFAHPLAKVVTIYAPRAWTYRER